MNIAIELKRLELPIGFNPDLTNDPGYCYTACYSGEDKRLKMAYLIGRYPSWGKVLAKGGLDNQIVSVNRNSDGTYHISASTGCGYVPKTLSIPRDAVVGSISVTMRDRALLALTMSLIFGLHSIYWFVPFLFCDYILECWYLSRHFSRETWSRGSKFIVIGLTLLFPKQVISNPINSKIFTHKSGDSDNLLNNPLTMQILMDDSDVVFTNDYFEFIKSPDYDEYCVQPSSYDGRTPAEWIKMNDFNHEAILSCDNVSQFDIDMVKISSGEYVMPDGFEEYHKEVMRSLNHDNPTENFCITDEKTRKGVVTLRNRNVGKYLKTLCPRLPADESWLKEARLRYAMTETQIAEIDDTFVVVASETLASYSKETYNVITEDIEDIAHLTRAIHDTSLDVVKYGLDKAKIIKADVMRHSDNVFEKGREIIDEVSKTTEDIAYTTFNVPNTIVKSTSNLIDSAMIYLEPNFIKSNIHDIKDVTMEFYDGVITKMPSIKTIGEDTGRAVKWSIDSTNEFAATSAKLIDKSGEIFNQIIDDSPDKKIIAATVWNTPTNISDIVSWIWNTTQTIISKDTAVTTVAELPWFTHKIGEAVAGPITVFIVVCRQWKKSRRQLATS
jgi:hypothetical protein